MAGASVAAYPSTVSVPGTSTAFADLPTTSIVTDTQFQITDPTKRRLDPTVAIVIQVSPDNSTWSAPAQPYVIDYLFGQVTFAASLGSAGAFCRFHSGNYIPVQLIGGAYEFTLTVTRDILESTMFGTVGARNKTPGMHDASISCEFYMQAQLNPVTGAQSLYAYRDAGTPLLVEINPAGLAPANGTYWRGWMVVESIEEKGAVAGLYQGTVKLNSAPVVPVSASNTPQTLFGWGT